MRIADTGIVFKGKPNSAFAKTCFPYVVQLSNGDLLATFQAASVKNGIDSKVLLARSCNGGKTWMEPVIPFDAKLDGRDGTLHLGYVSEFADGKLAASILWCDHFNDPVLEFFNPATGGLLPVEACISFSDDYGKTWSELRKIEKGDLEGTPTPVMGPVQTIDNTTLICPFETSKSYNDSGTWHHKAAYFVSHDNGRTWPEYRVVAYDPECKIYYWDHRLANLGNGFLIDFFWAFDAVSNKELNAYMSRSFDAGKTWSAPAPTPLVGQPWPIKISEDHFAVVLVDRTYSKTIKLYTTCNRGATFDASVPLVIYRHEVAFAAKDALNDQLVEMSNWSYGLPTGTCLRDGSLMILYYAGNDTETSIYCNRIEM